MPMKLDLMGQRFGRLMVLGPAENIGHHTAWLCRCTCGNEVRVKTYHLRRGAVRSCGCIVPEKGNVQRLSYVDGTCVEMIRANTLRKNNTSGCPGVYWDKSIRGWRVQIGFKGAHYTLGRFPREEKDRAVALRKEAEQQMHRHFLEWYEAQQSAE